MTDPTRQEKPGTAIADPGTVWVCGACGKRARSRYGFDENNKSTALDRGWDASCILNAILCVDSPILPWRAVEAAVSAIVQRAIAGVTVEQVADFHAANRARVEAAIAARLSDGRKTR